MKNGEQYPRIRAPKAGEHPDGMLREPKYAAQKAFEYLNDKHWHRYLFPFGCFFIENPFQSHQGWKDWTCGLTKGRHNESYINPHSVSMMDVRMLVNNQGYMSRFIDNLGIILTLKKSREAGGLFEFDVLQCFRLPGCVPGDHAFRRFLTLERYFHVFGSLLMHMNAMQESQYRFGGGWYKDIGMLQQLQKDLCKVFNVKAADIEKEFSMAVVETVRPNQVLSVAFPKSEILPPL